MIFISQSIPLESTLKLGLRVVADAYSIPFQIYHLSNHSYNEINNNYKLPFIVIILNYYYIPSKNSF